MSAAAARWAGFPVFVSGALAVLAHEANAEGGCLIEVQGYGCRLRAEGVLQATNWTQHASKTCDSAGMPGYKYSDLDAAKSQCQKMPDCWGVYNDQLSNEQSLCSAAVVHAASDLSDSSTGGSVYEKATQINLIMVGIIVISAVLAAVLVCLLLVGVCNVCGCCAEAAILGGAAATGFDMVGRHLERRAKRRLRRMVRRKVTELVRSRLQGTQHTNGMDIHLDRRLRRELRDQLVQELRSSLKGTDGLDSLDISGMVERHLDRRLQHELRREVRDQLKEHVRRELQDQLVQESRSSLQGTRHSGGNDGLDGMDISGMVERKLNQRLQRELRREVQDQMKEQRKKLQDRLRDRRRGQEGRKDAGREQDGRGRTRDRRDGDRREDDRRDRDRQEDDRRDRDRDKARRKDDRREDDRRDRDRRDDDRQDRAEEKARREDDRREDDRPDRDRRDDDRQDRAEEKARREDDRQENDRLDRDRREDDRRDRDREKARREDDRREDDRRENDRRDRDMEKARREDDRWEDDRRDRDRQEDDRPDRDRRDDDRRDRDREKARREDDRQEDDRRDREKAQREDDRRKDDLRDRDRRDDDGQDRAEEKARREDDRREDTATAAATAERATRSWRDDGLEGDEELALVPYRRRQESTTYYIKDNSGQYFHIDDDGCFKPGKKGEFEDQSGGILVKSGRYEGKYMYASAIHGYICGYSNHARTECTWSSGGPMEWDELPVDIYKGYFYSSARWFTNRDYKFTKEYKETMTYYIKDNNGQYFHIDDDGYFKPGEKGEFEDQSGGIRVRSGRYAGKYVFASLNNGYICGYSNHARSEFTWSSGGPMEWHGLPVDVYEGYFYSSARWFTNRDYKFTKEYKEAGGSSSSSSGGSSDEDAEDAEDLQALHDVFQLCDANGDGTINIRELIKACRQCSAVAAFLGLPVEIHQEGASRREVMEFFQGADSDNDREITWEELCRFYCRERRPGGGSPQRAILDGGAGGGPAPARPSPSPQAAEEGAAVPAGADGGLEAGLLAKDADEDGLGAAAAPGAGGATTAGEPPARVPRGWRQALGAAGRGAVALWRRGADPAPAGARAVEVQRDEENVPINSAEC